MKRTFVLASTVLATWAGLTALAAAPADDYSPKSSLTNPSPSPTTGSTKATEATKPGDVDTRRGSDVSAIPAADQRFVKAASEAGLAEVSLGELALKRAEAPSVRMFAQHMVDDHSKTNNELTALVTDRKGTVLADQPNAAHKGVEKRLATLSGARFDRAYIAQMVKDHKKAVADFRKQSKKSKDESLRTWAAGKLPVLQRHLLAATTINKDLKAGRRDTDVMSIFEMPTSEKQPDVNAPDITHPGASVPGQSDSVTGTGPTPTGKPVGDTPKRP